MRNSSHTTIRKHLLEDAELKFPITDSLLSGSYVRHTSIDPIKDADIILVLEETKVSDDKKTPNPPHVLEDLKAALDKIIGEIRTLPADEKRRPRELLEREPREADQGERAILSRSIWGKYAHLLTDSKTFIARKREETRRE